MQKGWVYVVLFVLELILIFVLLCPVLIWNAVAYLPAESYCCVPFTNLRGILCLCFNTYGNPVLILTLIYIRLSVFLRDQSQTRTSLVKKRQERDLVVIQRIVTIVAFLMVMCLPALILLITLYITDEQYYLLFRIEWLTARMTSETLLRSSTLDTSQGSSCGANGSFHISRSVGLDL